MNGSWRVLQIVKLCLEEIRAIKAGKKIGIYNCLAIESQINMNQFLSWFFNQNAYCRGKRELHWFSVSGS